MLFNKLDSAFLKYLIDQNYEVGDRLPSLQVISDELGISVGKLREQLEVARMLGVVSVRPRLGTQRDAYDFSPAVLASLLFGMGTGDATFEQFSQMRQALETAFWDQAVAQLTPQDKVHLHQLVDQAWLKLRGQPVRVPNGEHRELHLTIFSRLDNPFVKGILSAYWDAYEASELTRFVSYQYWVDVWTFHAQIVDALEQDDFVSGRRLLIEHFSILQTSPTFTPAD